MDNSPPKRKQIRLNKYDYSSNGAYFVTVCTQNRAMLFGDVVRPVGADLVSARVTLNSAGTMIEHILHETIANIENMQLCDYIIMPNHLHMILAIVRADTRSAPTTICSAIQAFKSKSTVEYIRGVKNYVFPPFDKRLWQRNYYEHIIRSRDEHRQIIKYIHENPLHWRDDRYYAEK